MILKLIPIMKTNNMYWLYFYDFINDFTKIYYLFNNLYKHYILK